MNEPDRSDARERIERWIEATRRVTSPLGSEWVQAIANESGLTVEGVRFALDEILAPEVDRAHDEIARFLSNFRLSAIGVRSCVGVVLASTVPTAGFRAVAWALAQAPRVVVRASRRGASLVAVIARSLPELVVLAPSTDSPRDDLHALVASLPARGALHVYGSSEAMQEARRATHAREDLALELHGPGVGAIVADERDVVDRAAEIARDVVAFDQRGCLSPRLVLVSGNASNAADHLHRALLRFDREVPRGVLDDDEHIAIRLALDAARFQGRALEGEGHAVLDLGHAVAPIIGPVGRIVPVLGVADVDDAVVRLTPLAAQLTQVATSDALRARLASIAPTCTLGAMQRPAFDGPVDRRAH